MRFDNFLVLLLIEYGIAPHGCVVPLAVKTADVIATGALSQCPVPGHPRLVGLVHLLNGEWLFHAAQVIVAPRQQELYTFGEPVPQQYILHCAGCCLMGLGKGNFSLR